MSIPKFSILLLDSVVISRTNMGLPSSLPQKWNAMR